MQPFDPNSYPYPLTQHQMHPTAHGPYPQYPPQPNYPQYSGMPMPQVSTTLPIYPLMWIQRQEVMATLQYYFSFGNLMRDPYLQSRMNRSLWVPLKEIRKFNKMVLLGITFKQLQEYAAQQMAADHSSFELDKTKTLMRPVWANMSMMNFRITFSTRIERRQRIAKAKYVIKKALKSVAKSEQLSHENEDVRLIILGQERNRTVSAYFNVPGIPSLITDFMNGYSETGWTIEVRGIKDSTVLSKEA